jgi:hypothetical protein
MKDSAMGRKATFLAQVPDYRRLTPQECAVALEWFGRYTAT